MDASLLQTVYLRNDTETKSRIEARDSWVTELTLRDAAAAESAPVESAPVESAPSDGGKPSDDLVARMKAVERKLERLRKQEGPDAATKARRAEELLTKLRDQVGARTESEATTESAPARSGPLDIERIRPVVEEAYLRTLSRYPNPEELETASRHVVDAGQLTSGLQDVIWALVNTKEFIVNH